MNAADIIARVAATYAGLAEYSDTGEMTVEGVKKGEFRTSFTREPGRLFFEGDILGHAYRLDLDARTAANEIAAHTGVTFAVARTIPRLLWPTIIGGRSILDVPASLLRNIDGVAELILTGSMPTRLLVDTRTWLITAHDFDAMDRMTIETRYRPVL